MTFLSNFGTPDKQKIDQIKQRNIIQGKAQLALKNLKNLFRDQREDSLTSLEVCYLLKGKQIAEYH